MILINMFGPHSYTQIISFITTAFSVGHNELCCRMHGVLFPGPILLEFSFLELNQSSSMWGGA